MTITESNLNQLIINELTQAKYNAATINQNELYVITDGVMQSTDVINALGYTPVNKAGDTMTGGLTIIDDTTPQMIIQHPTEVAGTTPSIHQPIQLAFKDSNYTTLGYIQNEYKTDGTRAMLINSRNADASSHASIVVGFDANGNAYSSFPKTECVDGQWVNSNTAIISSATSLNGSGSLTYRMVLPNDGHKYEVLLRGQVTTGATSGNYVFLSCAGNEITSVTNICGTQTRAANSVQSVGSGFVVASYVASGSTNLSISKNTSFNGNVNSLTMVAYRRIGTNT